MSRKPARPLPATGSLRAAWTLFRAIRVERDHPYRFYTLLARHSVDQVAAHVDLVGRIVLDVGGAAGYFTEEFSSRGATCYLVEPDRRELRDDSGAQTILADGYWLPFTDACADVCFSSNVLEHVKDPFGLLDEMVRVTRPGGLVYVAFTNWYSPWGGHEMAPWHYLGADYAARRYTSRTGRRPKHRFGENLFAIHIGPVLRHVRGRDDVTVIDARPRYYPAPIRHLLALPLVREFATWNLMLLLRRRENTP
jgi:SAM-dependent methyltransferase